MIPGPILILWSNSMHINVRRIGWLFIPVAAAVVFGVACSAPQRFEYPQTRKVDRVDAYHGTTVPDPYRMSTG